RRDTELAKKAELAKKGLTLTSKARRKTRQKKRIKVIKESTEVEMQKPPQLELEEPQSYQDEPLPWERKEYLKYGLYSIDLKLNDHQKSLKGKDKVKTSMEIFPLPIQYGQFLIKDQRNFCIPWDIMTAHKQGLLQRGFKQIKT
ncbi:12944_t:CDS:2, partial [Racocetra persica]